MTEDILSNDEIVALMEGVDKGELGNDPATRPRGEVRAHDFTRQDRIIRCRLPALEKIHERCARQLRDSLFRILHRPCDVSLRPAQMLTFADLLNGFAPPTGMHVFRARPLRGNGLVAIDASLASTFVDNFFGGAGRYRPDAPAREITPAELRIVQICVRETLSAFSSAWTPVTSLMFEMAGADASLQFATLAAAGDIVSLSRFHVVLEGGEGDVCVVLPYAMIEPVRHLLDGTAKNEPVERDERWSGALREELLDAEVELASNLVQTQIRIGDFLSLRAGDVIPIEMPDLVTLTSDDVPLFRTRFGTAGGNNAVRIVDAVGRSTHTQLTLKEIP